MSRRAIATLYRLAFVAMLVGALCVAWWLRCTLNDWTVAIGLTSMWYGVLIHVWIQAEAHAFHVKQRGARA